MNPNDIPYNGNLTWLKERTILFARHGSHAYGLNTATSDEDFRGVAIPPIQYTCGFLNKFEQVVSKVPDMVIFDIRKFMGLAADCNPHVIEVLWSEPMLLTPAGEKLVAARDLFLSRKAKHTFSGYAVAQLRRIQGHYRWLHNPPKAPPTRADLGLTELSPISSNQLDAAFAAVQKKIGEWHIDWLGGVDASTRIAIQDRMAALIAELGVTKDQEWQAAARTIGLDENFIRLLDLERQYKARHMEWNQYQTWLRERNPARAAMEAKFGFDGKYAMHLIRLQRMAIEIVTTGKVIVKRPDREELLAIRNGALKYEELLEMSAKADAELNQRYETSPLPNAPDRKKIDDLCVELVCDVNHTDVPE